MERTCADSEVLLELSGHTKAGMKVPVSWDPDEAVCIVEGTFSRGEVVLLQNQQGKALARAMVRYNSDALELIKGKKSQDIEQILGYEYGAVALHRDDMIVL